MQLHLNYVKPQIVVPCNTVIRQILCWYLIRFFSCRAAVMFLLGLFLLIRMDETMLRCLLVNFAHLSSYTMSGCIFYVKPCSLVKKTLVRRRRD